MDNLRNRTGKIFRTKKEKRRLVRMNVQKIIEKHHVIYTGPDFECRMIGDPLKVKDNILFAWKTNRLWVFGNLKNKIALELFELFYRIITKNKENKLTKPCYCKSKKKLIGAASCWFALHGGLSWEIRKCSKCSREFSVETGVY